MKLSIIGCGTMGQCILDGLLEEKKVPVNGFSIEMIWCTVSRKESLSKLVTRYSNHSSDTDGINLKFGLDNQEALQSSDVVIVALKPWKVDEVMSPLRLFLRDKLLISVAAGVGFSDLIMLSKQCVRVMPNIPCSISQGVITFCTPDDCDSNVSIIVRKIFEPLGSVYEFNNEAQMSPATAIAGCGPAFVALFIEAMADAGVLCGLPHSLSLELTCKTFMGSAKMILESGSHPASLRTLVCTPGGLSIAGISALEEHKVRSAIFKAVEAASGLKKDS